MDSRPTIAEIDLAALRHNFAQVQRAVPAGCGLLAIVKADAYGHGFMDISRELEALGVTAFGVAFLAEGIQLRKSGIDRPVLILGGVYPGQERKCVGFNLSTAVFSLDQARVLNDTAARLYRKAKIHVKIDTGMGRLGVAAAEAPAFFRELREMKSVELEGIISHFASADELDEDGRRFSERQAATFAQAVAEARSLGLDPRYVHIANSAAAFGMDLPFCNLARPGIVLYGALPSADFEGKLALRPIMRLRSTVAMLKWVEPGTSISYARRYTAPDRRLIASVPVGYADGYSRALTNRGEVLIRGERAPVVGTVCMDWIMVDVTAVPGVAVGDEVTLLGCDREGNCVRAEELASWAGTIPYEIFCGISKRVPRVYLNATR
ncbi:alanine racemase [Geobacter hydrogenophilus]|uniref:Alanine racemase n=1 Tax=Geobacter hydrogenophilus TaxID=40983 RepID=A0A9W6FZ10_9BACT|nr:alanine racemase [Geobacter hydrogenophilus]MBT0894764.1 alanine racemase [Geobacter hydrogenophilus]GLI37398.1 alanine racemase [Geobacter hydrogenophilus]